MTLTRRLFAKTVALGMAATALPTSLFAKKIRTVKVGHTGITWPNDRIDEAIAGVATLGFYGFETFGNVLEDWEAKGGLGRVLDQHNLPLISAYCNVNLTDPAKRKDEIDKAVRWGNIIKKYKGKIFVIGPNPVLRAAYNFPDHKTDIIASLNAISAAVTEVGLTAVLHQHTGTCVETRDETYAVMEAVDNKYVKFGPDIGQLTKGGSDAVKVVEDFLPLVQHMHLKDYNGVDDHLLGYCPLGKGTVNIPAILDLMEGRAIQGMVMGELDNDWHNMSPTPPVELLGASKSYLQTMGLKFRN